LGRLHGQCADHVDDHYEELLSIWFENLQDCQSILMDAFAEATYEGEDIGYDHRNAEGLVEAQQYLVEQGILKKKNCHRDHEIRI
jgi:hypothetical protein